jgi:hypothetical protein
MKYHKTYWTLAGIVTLILGISFLLYFIPADRIVEYVGVKNSYAAVFAVAAIGGLSTLTGTVLYAAIATFAAGGANPILIGLCAGIGIFLSDSIFFMLASYGRKSLPESWEPRIRRIQQYIEHFPQWVVLIAVYICIGLTPMPNDIVMIILALSGYRYIQIAPVLFAGGITIAMIVANIGNIWSF